MGHIVVLGVGLTEDCLTLAAARLLESGMHILLHTERIGCAAWLREKGIAYETLDALYDECEDFDEHACLAAEAVARAAEAGDVVYAVYDVRDRSVLRLSEIAKELRIIAGPPVEGALMGLMKGATRMLEASDWEDFHLSAFDNALVREIDSRALASEVKLKLMECYPDETICYVLSSDNALQRVPLYDLDRLKHYDHRSCALIPAQRELTKLERYDFEAFENIVHILRSPGGCPWDRAQTHETLRTHMLEEACEVIDAINSGDPDHICEELGDVLLQVFLHAEIASEHGEFTLSDALTAISRKMIERHSHIFGSDSAQNADSVLDLWMRNKMKEREQTDFSSVLREVSRTLPALLRSSKILDKALRAGVGERDVAKLTKEAVARLTSVIEAPEQRIGELLLTLCELSRAMNVDAENALSAAADRFVVRFSSLEAQLQSEGTPLDGDAARASLLRERVKL